MPRKLEAGGTYEYVLKSDRDKQPSPAFKLIIPSVRDDDALRDLTTKYRSTTTDIERRVILRDVLAYAVKGWNNMPTDLEFSIDAVLEILTPRECWELIGDVNIEAALTADERKKLESPHKSETS